MLSSEPSFKIGDRVRWRPEIAKVDWVGEVTGYPRSRMVQCDGHGCISQGLLEKVGETMHDLQNTMRDELDAVTAERDGLAEVVAMQCDLIMELQGKAGTSVPKETSTRNALEVDAHLDAVLRASGSALHNYTMAKTLGDMRAAMRKAMGEEGQPNEWFEKLVDHLELYLVRQTGSRRPLTIADADLRALAAHILD